MEYGAVCHVANFWDFAYARWHIFRRNPRAGVLRGSTDDTPAGRMHNARGGPREGARWGRGVAFPIGGYDEMKFDEIPGRPNDLSVGELDAVALLWRIGPSRL